MYIQIDPHTLRRALERGATSEEIRDVITTGFEVSGKKGRLGRAKIYEFNQIRLDKFYPQKRIEVYYVIENTMIITVTVYVFYGIWGQANADTI